MGGGDGVVLSHCRPNWCPWSSQQLCHLIRAALKLGTHGCFPLSLMFLTLCPCPWLALDHLVLEPQSFLVGSDLKLAQCMV